MNQCTLSQIGSITNIIREEFEFGNPTLSDLESRISEEVIKDFTFSEFQDNKGIIDVLKEYIEVEGLFSDSSPTIYKSNVVNNVSTYSIDDLFKGIPVAKKYFESYTDKLMIYASKIGSKDADTYVGDDFTLSQNLNDLKNKLFIELQEFLQSEGLLSTNPIDLFEDGRIKDYAYYLEITNLVSEYFFSGNNVDLITFSGKLIPNLNIDLNNKEHLFKAYSDLIFLSNFDSILNDRFKGIIEINYNYFNHLNNSIGEIPKYRINVKANSLLYWNNDTHDSKSSENKEDQITKMVVNSIPMYNKENRRLPEFMEMKDLYLLASMIHNFELKFGNKLKNTDENFKYFNGKSNESLLWYINEIKKAVNKEDGYISEFNQALKTDNSAGFTFKNIISTIYSLDNFINDPELNILKKEETSQTSLLSILSQVINNNFGMTYSVYDTATGLDIQNIYQQDFNSTYINNTVLNYMKNNKADVNMFNLNNEEELEKFNSLFNGIEDFSEDIYIYSLNNPEFTRNFADYITSKTGIPFNPNSFADLINEMKEFHSLDFIGGYFFRNKLQGFLNSLHQNFVNDSKFKKFTEAYTRHTAGQILSKVTKDAFYKALSNVYLLDFITKPVMNVSTALGNKVPSFRTSTLTFKDTELFELQRNFQKDKNYQSLLLLDNPAILGTSTKLEIVNSKDEESKNASKMTVREGFITDFRHEFIESILKNNTFQILLGNYSDKNSVFTKIINGDFKLPNSNKPILKENIEVILETVRTQGFNYYQDTFNKIFDDYKELFSKVGITANIGEDFENNIDIINSVLSKHKITDLLDTYSKLPYAERDPNLTITEELHYSKYKDGVSLNQLLADNYRIFKNPVLFGQFVELQETNFLNKVGTTKEIFKKNLSSSTYNDIYEKLDIDPAVIGSSTNNLQVEGKLNPLIKKWMWLNALFRNEYIFMTSKGEYMHPHKNNTTFRSGDFDGDYWLKYSREMSGRLESMAKRNVIFTASIESPVRNEKYSVPDKVNVAAIEDLTAKVYTTSGHKKYRQDAHDGSSYIDDTYSRLIEKSYPGKGYSGTKKQFGTLITPFGVTIKKDAETVLTNDRIRNSFESDASLLNKKEQMLGISLEDINIQWEKEYFDKFYNDRGKIFKINRVAVDNSGIKVFVSEKVEGGFTNSQLLEYDLNTLFDVWNAVGGMYSLDLDGNFDEGSNEILFDLVTDINGLKNKIIHILSNKSALKAGATNLNKSSKWHTNESLLYSTYDNRFMGPQLDASHGIDNSEIKEITQLVSALAQGGFTSDIAQEAYKDIANVIENSAKPYIKKLSQNNNDLYAYLTTKFIDTIVNSKGESLAKTLIHSIKEDGVKLPFSNVNFFNLFVRDVVTRLNNEFISRHYSGIGSVLIPSHGIIQLYDRILPDGRTVVMTQADLIQEALNEYGVEGFIADYGREPENNLELIEGYKNIILPDKEIGINEIEVGDSVRIGNNIVTLTTPDDYYSFKKDYTEPTVFKVQSKARDLKPTLHTFEVDGIKSNVFDFQSVRMLYELSKVINSIEDGKEINITDEVREIGRFSDYVSKINKKPFNFLNGLSKNNLEVLKIIENTLRRFAQREFQLLHENLVLPIGIDFNSLFNGDNFTDSLEDVLEHYSTVAITANNINFKPAEKILGDIFQSNFGRDFNDSMYKINTLGNEYFKDKLSRYYGKDNTEADLKIITDKLDKPIYIKYVDELGLLDRSINIKSSLTAENDLNKAYVRYNELGEEVYSFGDNIRVSTDENGNEIIYVKYGTKYINTKKGINGYHKSKGFEKNLNNIIKSFKGSVKAIVPLMNRTERKVNFFNLNEQGRSDVTSTYERDLSEVTANIFKKYSEINYFEDNLYDSSWFEVNKDTFLDKMSKAMFASWQKSHDLVDARIPGQAMQSFMPMRNVAYLNTKTNDSYVSINQIFLQGSDFDIDKAYTLGSGFTFNGKLALWTDVSGYSTLDQLNALEKLPLPNPDIEVTITDNAEDLDLNQEFNTLAQLLAGVDYSYELPTEAINVLNTALRKINNSNGNIYLNLNSGHFSQEDFKNLIDLHNKSKSYLHNENSVKNSVVSRIKQIIADPRNQILANTPVTVQNWHDAISRVEKLNKSTTIQSTKVGNVEIAGLGGIPGFRNNGKIDYQKLKEYAVQNDMVYTLRENSDTHFGNPYSPLTNIKNTINVDTAKEAVEKFVNWVLYNPENIQESRRQWVLNQLKSGVLKGKKLLYYSDIEAPSHANALDYLINVFDWSNYIDTRSINDSFTNHSGGAIGSDSEWDYFGRLFGVVNHNHYYFEGNSTPKGNVSLSRELITEANPHVLKANESLNRTFPTEDEYINNLLRRNWFQVKNAEAIYAIGELSGNIVKGGTGWAVQMAIDNNKPVYVFDQNDNSWFVFDYEKNSWKRTSTPTLVQNYAGIGTRELNSSGLKAIKEVYENTFGKLPYNSSDIYKDLLQNSKVTKKPTEERKLLNDKDLLKKGSFRGLKIEFKNDLEVGGRLVRNPNGNFIQVNLNLVKEVYKDKRWTKPRLQADGSSAKPLSENVFGSYEELLTFVLLHEYYHTKLLKKTYDNGTTESTGDYETRVNNHALKDLSTNYARTKRALSFNDIIKAVTPTSESSNITLTTEQQFAHDNILDFFRDPSKKTHSLIGYAGTGKTTVINKISEELKKLGIGVVISTPTHKANLVIKNKDPKADVKTLHSLLGLAPDVDLTEFDMSKVKYSRQNEVKLGENDILIIDESSMINDVLFDFIEKLIPNKILFVGDDAQLSPVLSDKKSKALTSTEGIDKLQTVIRTDSPELLNESIFVRENGHFTGQSAVKNGKGIIFTNHYRNFIEKASEAFKSEEYKKDPLYTKVIAYSNAEVSRINHDIRENIFGKDVPEYVIGEPLFGYSNIDGEYRQPPIIQNSFDYKIIDVTEGEKSVDMFLSLKGHYLTIEDVYTKNKKNIFIVSRNEDSDKIDSYINLVLDMLNSAKKHPKGSPQYGNFFGKYYSLKREFMFPIHLHYIDEFGRQKRLLDKALDYGYAHTIHKAQGSTYKYTFMSDNFHNVEGELPGQLRYVGVTRSENTSIIYNSVVKSDDLNLLSLAKSKETEIDEDFIKEQAELDEIQEDIDINKLLSSYDILSYYQQQYNASVGKDDVGIAANGVKTLYALSSYYNNYYRNNVFEDNLKNSPKYFNKTLSFYKDGEVTELGGSFTTIADVQMTNAQKELFRQQIPNFDIRFVNAADNLSGFLSAATDNAKELIMAKVNASTDLAAMHIYLMILGLDINQVVEIMTSEVMGDIIKEMDYNMFESEKKTSFDTAIKKLAKKYAKDKNYDSENNLRTYKKIYDGAQELTILSRLLGINQKRAANTWEIYNYMNNLPRAMYLAEQKIPVEVFNEYSKTGDTSQIVNVLNKISEQSNVEEVVRNADLYDILNGGFDFELYFQNPQYKQATKDYYNLIKETFNIFDVIDTIPHFKQMIDSLALFHSILKKYSSKYNYVFNEFREYSDTMYPTEQSINKGILYYDTRAREEWLKTDKMLNFTFNVKDLMRMANKESMILFTSNQASDLVHSERYSETIELDDSLDPVISLDTNFGIANFKILFEQVMLPILQRSLKEKNFLKIEDTLSPFSIKTTTAVPTIPTSNSNIPALVKQFQTVLNNFDNLDRTIDVKNQVKNTAGEFIKWKDILFVYNLLVNNERYGDKRITPLFQNYMKEKDTLGYDYIKFWSQIDNGYNLIEDYSIDDVRFFVNNDKGSYGNYQATNSDFVILSNIHQSDENVVVNKTINNILRLLKEGGFIITLKC